MRIRKNNKLLYERSVRLSQLLCNTVMELEMAAGFRGEIISILQSSLFLTKLQITCGGRLLSHEHDD